jgi:hypothetical protein
MERDATILEGGTGDSPNPSSDDDDDDDDDKRTEMSHIGQTASVK